MQHIYTGACIALAAALASWGAPAATRDSTALSDTVSLGNTVITATKKPQKQDNLSTTVNVLTREELDMLQPRTATDVLHTLPGVFVHKTSAFGRADVTIRGTGDRGRRMMVLMNGRPVKMGIFGCTVTHCIPATDVQRIEVVKGPASVLYGSDAMGGVVNIMSTEPQNPLEINAFGMYGMYDTRHVRARVGGGFDQWHYTLAGDYQYSDGHVDNAQYNAKDISTRMGYSILDNVELELGMHVFNGKKHEPAAAAFDSSLRRWYIPPSPTADAWNDYARGAIDLSLDATIRNVDLYAMYYRNMGEHEFSDGWHSRDHTDGFTAHADAHLLDMDGFANVLSAGIELRSQAGEDLGQDTSFSVYELAAFVQDEQTLFNRLTLDAGARYTHGKTYDGHVSARAGAVFHIRPRLSARANVATGFRAPQINDLYLFPPSNPDLKPETSTNYEAGITCRPLDRVFVDVAGFYTTGEDLITKVPVSGMPPFQFRNEATFKRRGIETALNLQCAPHTRITGGYTFIDPYEHAQGIVQNKLDLRLHYSDSLFSALIGTQYLANYYADDAQTQRIDTDNGISLVYARSSWRVYRGTHLFARIDNALGRNYAQFTDLPTSAGVYLMPGMEVAAGVKYVY
jgi:iron complex outermembrane receptor protein